MLEQEVICHLRGLRMGRYNTVILRKPTHLPPLPVGAPELRPRCFLLPGACSGGEGVNTPFVRVSAGLPAMLRVVIRVVTVDPRRVAWSIVFQDCGSCDPSCCAAGVSRFRWLKKVLAALEGAMEQSMYFDSKTVELVDQPPA